MQCNFYYYNTALNAKQLPPLGEVSQMCSSMGLSYCCIQQSDEKIKLIMAHLGVTDTSAHDSSEDSTVIGTEEILEELSEVQRHLADVKQTSTTRGKGKGKGKAIEGKVFHTRSKGSV